jgi:hypothetical protein
MYLLRESGRTNWSHSILAGKFEEEETYTWTGAEYYISLRNIAYGLDSSGSGYCLSVAFV